MTTDVTNIPTGTSNSDDLSEQVFGGEAELRELVCQSLENDGILSRLKAELRAAVFKTIERATKPTSTHAHPSGYDSIAGRVSRALVLDWLEHSRLLYTEDVLKVETTGPNHPAPLTHAELLEQLHIKPNQSQSQPLLHVLINQSKNAEKQTHSTINSLPAHIERSIDSQFPTEKINDLNRLREHFRSLFAYAFDPNVLDAFVNKNIPSSAASFSKRDYEELCLKWMQACSKALTAPPQVDSVGPVPSLVTTQVLTSRSTVNTNQRVTQAARSMSPMKESKSSSSSASSSPTSSSSEEKRKSKYNFTLPTTQDSHKSVVKKVMNIIPPSLINFGDDGNNDEEDEDEEEEDTSNSILSKRNATPAALNRLNNIYNIDQGDQTPRSRTTLQKTADHGARNLPIEYDDESMSLSVSHSIISSVDDITVDKASTSAANIDFIEDF